MHSAQKSHGFTLIELMVTMSIIAVLATVGLVVFSTAQKTARVSKRIQDLKALRTSIELYKTSVGYYPYQAALGCIPGVLSPTYMAVIPTDPYNSLCYQYLSDTNGNSQGVEYKVRTNTGIITSEMGWADYNTQRSLLDPAHDSATGNGCTIDDLTANVGSEGWAYYTGGACGY